MKKIILSGLLIATLFCNAGCTDQEIAAGIIGVGIGIGIAAGGSHHHGHYHGYDRRPPRYRQCGRYRCYSADTQINLGTSPQVMEFAQRHKISLDAAQQIQDAFEASSTQGLDSFEQIGLDKTALTAIAQRSLPSAESMSSLAAKLDLSKSDATRLVQSLITDFEAQASNVESDYWKACMAKGTWKTPQNLSCSQTFWAGCAPATGATLCM